MTYNPDTFAGAHCADHDPELWFSEDDAAATAQAKAICGMCPAQTRCLTWALDNEHVGVWGGLTTEGRHNLRRYTTVTLPARNDVSVQARFSA